jgi:hypothetical protein
LAKKPHALLRRLNPGSPFARYATNRPKNMKTAVPAIIVRAAYSP